MSADFTIKQGDTLPAISAYLKVGGAVDPNMATISTVKLALAKRATPDVFFFIGNAVVVSPTTGQVAYNWQAADTATPGEYYAEWHVTYQSGAKRTFPTVGRFTVSIEAKLLEA